MLFQKVLIIKLFKLYKKKVRLLNMSVSEAQRKAIANWNAKNKDKRNFYTKRSMARSFIRNLAQEEDLEELSILIKDRRAELLK